MFPQVLEKDVSWVAKLAKTSEKLGEDLHTLQRTEKVFKIAMFLEKMI